MKRVALAAVVTTCVAVSGVAKNLDTGYEPKGLDELTKQKGIFKTTLVRTVPRVTSQILSAKMSRQSSHTGIDAIHSIRPSSSS